MAWAKDDLKLFAAGLAVGGKWKGKISVKADSFEMPFVLEPITGSIERYKDNGTDDFTLLIIEPIIGDIVKLEEN